MNKNMSFSVSGQRIELTDAAMLVAGTVNEYTARFTFDESWDGYQRTAVFYCNTVEREQLLTDDACTVPWEVLVANGYLRVGVYGTKDGSRLPTIWTERRLYINPGAGPTQEAAEPSPTLVEQLMARMGDLAALNTEDKSSLVAAINEVWSSGGSGGASVTDAAINEDGHLIITLSTGETIDAGYAVGPAGAPGKDGQDGAPGKDGAAGAPGKDGVSPTATVEQIEGGAVLTVKDASGTTTATLHDGATGPAGPQGPAGANGLGVPVATAEDAGKVPVVNEDGSGYELGDVIKPPTTAAVGQTIVVKAVDADGKPTAWSPVDFPSGGGSSGFEVIGDLTTEEIVQTVEFPYTNQDCSEIIVLVVPSAAFKPSNTWFRLSEPYGRVFNFAHINTINMGTNGFFVAAKITKSKVFSTLNVMVDYMWNSNSQYSFHYDRERQTDFTKVVLDFFTDIPVGTVIKVFAR